MFASCPDLRGGGEIDSTNADDRRRLRRAGLSDLILLIQDAQPFKQHKFPLGGVRISADRDTGAREAVEAESVPYRTLLGLADLGLAG
jgi:hypothetical protein